ncbi:hypothetical protein B0J11DRAFT_516193 [Dendryphion nanum]|uniref:Uncharacterized protein n=1 Tax=Dendryphion nanum TaxID=256645 RepID=A0A9P9EKK3_9PLEO|nr:hypothetical protein B0J11DRAFT_516193 [Dendryphion nanum]
MFTHVRFGMPHRVQSEDPMPAEAERPRMGAQDRHLQAMYPRAAAHPFPVRVPAFPDDDRDQTLYQIPGFQYPHTLSFLNNFGPNAEEKMIAKFEAVHGKVEAPVPISPVATCEEQDPKETNKNANCKGWGFHIKALTIMGLVWALQKIKELSEREVFITESPKQVPKQVMKRKDRVWCVRNGGGPKSFLPSHIYDNSSDTEEEDDEEFTARYFGKKENTRRPAETVFGENVAVTRSMGGRLHAYVAN